MKKYYALLIIGLLVSFATSLFAQNLVTPYELGNGNQSTTYDDCIAWYQKLDRAYKSVRLDSIGRTDIGRPLHLVVIDGDGDFSPEKARSRKKNIVFIINGIHPGEPEGIDASMRLARELVNDPIKKAWLKNTVVLIVPVFNVDGSLRRNSHSRANQNGPEAYGFRANSRNLDLNRDFIKLDSRNTQSLITALRKWNPDLFLDTHTSNGADYQHTMTLIESQADKMQVEVGGWMRQKFSPRLYAQMEKAGFPMCPYVNTERELPDSGIIGFLETPRYSSGYGTLFHTASYVLETHMLKPYPQRVAATYALLDICLSEMQTLGPELQKARAQAAAQTAAAAVMPLNWKLNRQSADSILFRGYAAAYKGSEVHGETRLYYDQNEPWSRKIPFLNHYEGVDSVLKPKCYVIPQAWHEVIERLEINQIPFTRLKADTLLALEFYLITDYQSSRRPYEGHYLHYSTQTSTIKALHQYRKGDVMVFTGKGHDRFVVETLEPRAVDSYFNWGFFDGILQQKEYFSAYVYEDTAAELLRNNPDLRQRFEVWKNEQDKLPTPGAQLDWLYRNSPNFEGTAQLYPVGMLR